VGRAATLPGKLVFVWFFVLIYAGLGLHIAEGLGEEFGEFFVAHVLYLLDGDWFAVGDVNLAGSKELRVPRPAFEGAIYNDRDNRRIAASCQEAEAGFEWSDFTIFRAGAFGKDSNAASFFELIDDLSHCGYIRLAQFHGYGVDRGNERAEEPIGKKCITGDKARMSLYKTCAKYRVEIALVVADKYKGAFSGDIVLAVCSHAKEQDTKYPANPACEPEPYCIQYFSRRFPLGCHFVSFLWNRTTLSHSLTTFQPHLLCLDRSYQQ